MSFGEARTRRMEQWWRAQCQRAATDEPPADDRLEELCSGSPGERIVGLAYITTHPSSLGFDLARELIANPRSGFEAFVAFDALGECVEQAVEDAAAELFEELDDETPRAIKDDPYLNRQAKKLVRALAARLSAGASNESYS